MKIGGLEVTETPTQPVLTPVEFVKMLKYEIKFIFPGETIQIDPNFPVTRENGESLNDFLNRLHYAPIFIGGDSIRVKRRPYGSFRLGTPGLLGTILYFHSIDPHQGERMLSEIVFDEIMRILFRLTQRPSESLVPLRDLIDDRDDNTRYSFYRFLLSYLAQKVPFPFHYYPLSAVFERGVDVVQQVVVIENVRAVLSGMCPRCHGILLQPQIDQFTQNQTITCEYCDHSMKAEWVSQYK